MNVALVEDEKKLANSIKQGLELEKYLVTIFNDGYLAEKNLLANSYDIIILDLILPGKDGFVICKSLRTAQIATPILVLTARDTISDKVRALDSGADDLLTKPFSFDEFLARLRALQRRPVKFASTGISVQDITLNKEKHEVARKGIRINLTIKEFELLELLIGRPGYTIGRKEILKVIWNFDDDEMSNVVDVHIFNLRKKIDGQFSKKYIRTIRGLGYAFTG